MTSWDNCHVKFALSQLVFPAPLLAACLQAGGRGRGGFFIYDTRDKPSHQVMIDLHCHILPGIDDGPSHTDETMKMAMQARNDGITTCVATPHYHSGVCEPHPDSVIRQCVTLNHRLASEKLDLMVLPGMEVHLMPGMVKLLDQNQILTLGDSNFVLVEIPDHPSSGWVQREIDELIVARYRPIIAHPERCPLFQHKPDFLFELINHGIVTPGFWTGG